MGKFDFKGNREQIDLGITVHNSEISDAIIANIEKASLAQVPMSEAMMGVFRELKSYGFFVPYEPISRPHVGGIRPDGWIIAANYSNLGQIFAHIKEDAPAWIKDIASMKDVVTREERFSFYSSKWSHLYAEAVATNSYYHLYTFIHNEVTRHGKKPISGYNAPSPLEILERVFPEKYNANKKAS